MRNILISTALLVGVSLAGCYTEEQVGVGYGGGGYGYAATAGPSMAYVSPGVQVVADYDYPVFYSDGLYWRSYGGGWYSSRWYDRGWAINYRVPYGIRGIARPGMYAHYHAGGGYIRDHRAYGAPAYRGGAAVRTPAYRAPARTYRPAATVHRR
jgi:hypothetical protein